MAEIYYKVIYEDEYNQLRLNISEFREVEYLHLRYYYKNFDSEWLPTKKGVSIPVSIDVVKNLFIASAEILSLAESKEIIEEYFGDTIRNVYT